MRLGKRFHRGVTDLQHAALETLRESISVPPRWLRLVRKPATMPMEEAISRLGTADPAELIPELAPLYWRSPAHLRKPLSGLITALANRLATGSWPRVDEWIRLRLISLGPAVELPFPADPALVVLALCHPSGRLRERAIGLTDTLPLPLAASLLLVRVNDWAGPVRHRAELKLPALLARLVPSCKLALVPLVDRLRHCGRHGKSDALVAWRMSLITPFDEDRWLDAWHRSDARNRRIYLDLLKQSGVLPGPATREALLGSNDRMALLWYLKGILPRLESEAANEATAAISRSRAVPVRRAWLEHLVESQSDQAVAALKNALIDRSRSLRHFARYHLARLAPLDFPAYYRSALGSSGTEAVALRGLAEVAPGEGHLEAMIRLSSADPGVRKAAIECLSSNKLEDHVNSLLEIASDSVPSVSKVARKRLLEIAQALGFLLMENPRLAADGSPELRIHLIRLAPFFRKWHGLDYLLHQVIGGQFPEEVLEALDVWRKREGRSFIGLKEDHKRRLLNLLDELILPEGLADTLRFILKRAE